MTSFKMKKHQKHSKLSKRNNGNYAPNEISILGVKCSVISDLVSSKNCQKQSKNSKNSLFGCKS